MKKSILFIKIVILVFTIFTIINLNCTQKSSIHKKTELAFDKAQGEAKGTILLIHDDAPLNIKGQIAFSDAHKKGRKKESDQERDGVQQPTYLELAKILNQNGWNTVRYTRVGVYNHHTDFKEYAETDLNNLMKQLRMIWNEMPQEKPRIIFAWGGGSIHALQMPLNEVDALIILGGIATKRTGVTVNQFKGKESIKKVKSEFDEALSLEGRVDRKKMFGFVMPFGRLFDENNLEDNWTYLKDYPHLPTLILHGDADIESDVSQAKLWNKKLPKHNITTVIRENGNHAYGIEANKSDMNLLANEILNWLEKSLSNTGYKFSWYGTSEKNIFSALKEDRKKAENLFVRLKHNQEINSDLLPLLIENQFIRKVGNSYSLNFSIIEESEYIELVNHAKSCAEFIFKENRNDLSNFNKLLEKNHYKSAPLIWFSIILDSYMWSIFQDEYTLTYYYPPKNKGVPHGMTGYYWAIEDVNQKKHVGTNSYDLEMTNFKLNWSEQLLKNYPKLNRFFWADSKVLLDLYLDKKEPINEATDELLREYKLVDEHGQPNVTIWKKESFVDKASLELANKLAKSVVEYWTHKNVDDSFNNTKNSKYNFCIYYHLMMYAFLDLLEKKNLMTYNKALFSKVDVTGHSINDLILITIE
jgi:hypothetical protein